MNKAALGGSGNTMKDLGKQLSFLALTRGSRRIGGTAKQLVCTKENSSGLKSKAPDSKSKVEETQPKRQ